MTARADSFDDAQKAFNKKQYRQAIKLLDVHLAANKEDSRAYLLRGRAYANTRNYPPAISDASRAILLDPKNAAAFHFRGRWHAKDDQTRDKAFADFGKAIELDPKVDRYFLDRGLLYLKGANAQDHDKARLDFDAAIKINPKSAPGYAGRGQAVLLKGATWRTFRKGNLVYKTAVGYQPGAVSAALVDFNTAIGLDPKVAESRRGRATCYQYLHEEAKELADRKELALLDNKDAQNLNRLGWILATSDDDKLRDPKAGLEAAKRAAELTEQKDAHTLDTLAAAHAAAGEYREAVLVQQRVIEMLQSPPGSVFHERLELYKQNKPCRYKSPPPRGGNPGVPPEGSVPAVPPPG